MIAPLAVGLVFKALAMRLDMLLPFFQWKILLHHSRYMCRYRYNIKYDLAALSLRNFQF